MTQLVIRIAARRDGFRRAGLAHPKAPTDHPLECFDPGTLQLLESEPLLSVQYLDLARPEYPGKPTLEELLADLHEAIAQERAAEEAAADIVARAEKEAAEAQAAAGAAALKAQEEAAAEAAARQFTPPGPPAGATDASGEEEADGKTSGSGDPAAAAGGAAGAGAVDDAAGTKLAAATEAASGKRSRKGAGKA